MNVHWWQCTNSPWKNCLLQSMETEAHHVWLRCYGMMLGDEWHIMVAFINCDAVYIVD
ncbi:hypothetical protein KIN20_001591 [Parelaphostrongylus tenuis]|uniref:Uncharacterized protein n=1 Tax=Parelaphostrongylus tenuis TaxID=148309 RepID=A0AAD5LX70_PARTN|nr:hypothetical protein KIN20_001591 [Parelaphostrongylus tenuis]